MCKYSSWPSDIPIYSTSYRDEKLNRTISLYRQDKHHARHISRWADSRLAANLLPSQSNEFFIFLRNSSQNEESTARFSAHRHASSQYSSSLRAMKSVKSIVLRIPVVCRAIGLFPVKVRTGTPIHKASQLVIPPLKGKGSRAIKHLSFRNPRASAEMPHPPRASANRVKLLPCGHPKLICATLRRACVPAPCKMPGPATYPRPTGSIPRHLLRL